MSNKILITGSYGFIGSCLFRELSSNHELDITSVDKHNIKDVLYDIYKYDTIVHMGAISETNSSDSNEIYNCNIDYTLHILKNCKPNAKIIYASSASVYGNNHYASEDIKLNMPSSKYSQSKLIIDNIVENFFSNNKIIGLRFFNVCSFHDENNKKQPSPTFTFAKSLKDTKTIKLFNGSKNIFRDFIFIDDVLKIIQFFMFNHNTTQSHIFNVGSGIATSFEDIADCFINTLGYGKKVYIDKPTNLTNNYQTYTCANIEKLRNAGYSLNIPSILEYIKKYGPRN